MSGYSFGTLSGGCMHNADGEAPLTRTVAIVDNRDSFVYNLVDAIAVQGHFTHVLRNSVSPAQVRGLRPDVIVLSPGPGHPHTAGNLMGIYQMARACEIPVLGICLGFQAILSAHGAEVRPCGPVHGITDSLSLTSAGRRSPLFAGLADPATKRAVPIARYHSLGCTELPPGLTALGFSASQAGPVVMAAVDDEAAPTEIGLQFHPESLLTPDGPVLLHRCLEALGRHTKERGRNGARRDEAGGGGEQCFT